jgi:hypothetical protein
VTDAAWPSRQVPTGAVLVLAAACPRLPPPPARGAARAVAAWRGGGGGSSVAGSGASHVPQGTPFCALPVRGSNFQMVCGDEARADASEVAPSALLIPSAGGGYKVVRPPQAATAAAEASVPTPTTQQADGTASGSGGAPMDVDR